MGADPFPRTRKCSLRMSHMHEDLKEMDGCWQIYIYIYIHTHYIYIYIHMYDVYMYISIARQLAKTTVLRIDKLLMKWARSPHSVG